MIRLDTVLLESLGGQPALETRVLAFAQALEAHRSTVDVPAPIEHPLVEAIVRAGGWSSVEIVEPDPAPPVTNGPPPPSINWSSPLETVKAVAPTWVDVQAEYLRQQYITPGAGQALEYQATEAEARKWVTGESLNDYPFLKAEADAVFDSTGTQLTAAQVVSAVLANADAWIAVGAHIKKIRRARKTAIEAAESVEAVKAILAADWGIP